MEFPGFNGGAQDLTGAGGGCTVILKPAEQTPLVAGAMCAAGFPEGVVNLIHACKGDAVGRTLINR
ncbi:msl8688 [Mesorhizobium japonicum MAFF 303099]|uniref:Msl8688 protein n=1 Tax=Mesorhizobium japonicum (strain LMG 29417 / CECT 9101 / MAFF 303099) TaxID=266835 RepID=Q98A47_RHILO|nr:msl8688 [Mesorhizobium japonicum MAFF 303099]